MRSPPVSSSDHHFYVRLESARGIAALVVTAMHALSFFSPKENADIGAVVLRDLLNGQGAVNFFFVLSGFVLGASLSRSLESSYAIGPFLLARIFRIYPTVIITVLIYAALFIVFGERLAFWNGEITASKIVANATLFDVSMNGLMWSLQVEMLAVPMILAVGVAERKFGQLVLAIAVALTFGMCFARSWSIGTISLLPLFGFALGMAVRHWQNSIARLSPTAALFALFVALIAFQTVRLALPPSTAGYRWITIVECASASIIVALIAFSFDRPMRWLEHPVFRFYGRISYSLYLIHPLAIMILAWFVPVGSALQFQSAATMTVLLIVISTPIAWLCWYAVEVPGISLGRLLRRQLRPPKLHASN